MLGWFNAWGKKQAGGAAVPEQVVLWRDLVGIEKKKFNKECEYHVGHSITNLLCGSLVLCK